MKPNFALNLTDDSIALLHRTARGWMEVGSTPLDAPDLGEALNYLRRSALGLAPHGIATKLVIPNSQILYLEVEAPGPDAAYRRAQIRKALEGRTPYAVEDLVFDWRGTGSTVQVAVIARETLDEAEQFAAQYRFNPVSFVAIPTKGQFAGEPWFGPSALAATLLPDGEKVERDQDAVTIVARELPRAEPAPAPEPAPEPYAEPVREPIADLAADVAVDVVPQDAPAEREPEPEPAEVQSVTENTIIDDAPAAVDDTTAPASPLSRLDAMVADAFPSSAVPLATPSPEEADAPPPFASRRSPEPAAPVAAEIPVPDPGKTARAPRLTPPFVANADEARPRARVESRLPPKAEPRSEPRVSAPATVQKTETLASAIAASTQDAAPARNSFAAHATPEKALRKDTAGPVTAPSIPIAGRKPKAQFKEPAQAVAKPTGAQTFGARTTTQRGKPRYLGLILTIVLLVFLAVVAAWSSFYLASFGDPEPTAVAAGDVPAVDEEMLADMQDPAELAATDAAATDGAATDGAATDAAASDSAATDAVAAIVPPTEPAAAAPEDAAATGGAETGAAATGAAETDPATSAETAPPAAAVAESAGPAPVAGVETAPALSPSSDAQDEIFLATVDPHPAELDAFALPKPDVTVDLAPVAQMPAPPFGTLYQFDANGLIKPTPEGILTPDGVFLIAGKPARIPPPRPVELIAAAQAAAAPATTIPAAPDTTLAPAVATPVADPALAGFKPRARPEGLVPPTAAPASPADQTSLAIPEGSRLTSLRPHARPAAIVALADAARNASAAASLSAPADPTTEPQAEAQLSGFGIAVSRRPVGRPRDFSKAVEAAVAAAVQPSEEPAPAPQAKAAAPEPTQEVANLAPEATDEPDLAAAAPHATQRGTVAKQATFANAINLSKLNLIGVYGTSNNRSAMIRQPNGRYTKVQVGDRVDGGTIAAITQDEVRYQKSGRLISLKLPKG